MIAAAGWARLASVATRGRNRLDHVRGLRTLGFLLFAGGCGSAVPCASGTAACTQWISLGSGPGRSLVYRTYPVEVKNRRINRALVIIHGGGRDADYNFRTAVAAALLANALDSTIVVAPRFASNQGSCHDSLATDEVNWDCGEGSAGGWRAGSPSVGSSGLTSFDLTDAILSKLAQQDVFPNLRTITVAGFSGGGQYVNRYAMANQVHERLGVAVTYVVASPSNYGYPDSLRPATNGSAFETFRGARNCPTYNVWSYGLTGRTGYSSKLTDEQMRTQLVSRPVTYLIGRLESPQSPALDTSCAARAQGPSRLARGQAFFKYITEKYGARHKMIVVPECGHQSRCILTAEAALAILFPKR